jgi:sugar transferase (PEP-CTERM/EpsH1 system associated)
MAAHRGDARSGTFLAMSTSAPTNAARGADPRPLIAHVVYRFDVGGLENGLVNLLNRLPEERFRHAVIALTEATSFRRRVRRDDVAFVELHKAPGSGVRLLPRLARLLHTLAPAIVHTRNLAALDAVPPAWLARVPIRIHGEHGRDVDDLDGSNRRNRLARRLHRPFVTQYVADSDDLARYLVDVINVQATRVTRIVNGVDTSTFHPASIRTAPADCPFSDPALRIVGAVGRLQAVKNQALLARAFVRALQKSPGLRRSLRLVIVGEGPLRPTIEAILAEGNARELAWLPGSRDDVPSILRGLDMLVLPSLAEGISNTILEAMASGLPVVATRVGGNAELVADGETGVLVASGDVEALADALIRYASDATLAAQAGRSARARAERLYSLDGMVEQYASLYERLIAARKGIGRALPRPTATTGNV